MVRISFQIIRNTDIPSVICCCDQSKYIFNVPETFQRYYREHRIKMSQGPQIFFTRLNTETISGLIGFMLTLFVENFAVESSLYGPRGICDLLSILRYNEVCGFKTLPFSAYEFQTQRSILGLIKLSMIEDILRRQNNCQLQEQLEATKQIKIQSDVQPKEQNDASKKISNGCYEDQFLTIIPILLDNQQEMQMEQNSQNSTCISYIVVTKQQPGKVLTEKIKEFNIQKHQIGKLIKQGSIIIDGKEIKVEDIREKETSPEAVMILDIEDIKQIELLKKSQVFCDFLSNVQSHKNNLQTIIHLAKPSIVLHHRYQQFLEEFSKYNHILANFKEEKQKLNQEFLLISAQVSNQFNSLFPRNFPKINQHFIDNLPYQQNNIRGYIPLFEYVVLPYKQQGYKQILNLDQATLIKQFPISQELEQQLSQYQPMVNIQDQQRLTFLGTCSMKPGKYRNVSSILLHDKMSDSFILLDSGEGTWKQIYDQQINILDKPLIIWISHVHSDHHLGMLTILHQCTVHNQVNKVFLIIPFLMVPWVYYYERILGIKLKVKIVANAQFINSTIDIYQMLLQSFHVQRVRHEPTILISEKEILILVEEIQNNFNELNSKLNPQFRIKQILSCPVEHCPQAYGISIEYEDGKRVTYSGDTRPCKNFEDLSRQANIMIHEATFSDDLHENAIQNMHATQREAVELGIKANAETIVLTHFSQRYAKSIGNIKVDEVKLMQKKEQNLFSDIEYQNALKEKTVHAFDHLGGSLDEYKQLNKVTQMAALLLPEDE